MQLSADQRLDHARAVLEQHGIAATDLLSPEIAESWKRCIAAGLDPRRSPKLEVANRGMLRRHRERHGLVFRLASAEIRNLYQQIAGTNYMIALAAPDGMLLEALTDVSFEPTARETSIRPGSLWAERDRGTNAFGTVIATSKPVTVHGGEHFFHCFRGLTCTAAPIYGPDGHLAAVLDASSDCRSRQQHTQALVTMAVTQIENGLFREYHRHDLILAFHHRDEYLYTLSVGLLALDLGGKILGANAQARFLLQGLPALPGRQLEEVFHTRIAMLLAGPPQRHRLRDHVGSTFVAIVENSRPNNFVLVKPSVRKGEQPRFVAEDPVVACVVRQVEQAAQRRLPILIHGKTGTGKEELARHAHNVSGRRGALVPVNCAAVPRGLIESELFGHAEGAFTGARSRGAIGLVEEADGGTLFLDEIGDMPLDLQAVLLRVLDDWTVRPVGGGRCRKVDVLLLAATNADLQQRIQEGAFRADLYYRLNTVEARLPCLSQRTDFVALAKALLGDLAPGSILAPEALAELASYPWPGNIRELRSVLTRLVLASPADAINPAAVRAVLGRSSSSAKLGDLPLREQTRVRIVAAYAEEGNNITRAARRLGVSRNLIYRALRN
jgi:sigma-54 dependent transcriptional regulator, acetoin dehydrogenase operon transcriptional activator AcoR